MHLHKSWVAPFRQGENVWKMYIWRKMDVVHFLTGTMRNPNINFESGKFGLWSDKFTQISNKKTINFYDLQILNIQIHYVKDTRWMRDNFPFFWRKACICNLGQNIWNKIKKISKIGQKEKTLITASAKLYCKRFISGRITGRWALSPTSHCVF